MSRLSIVILTLMLSACATTAKYEKILDTWVGEDELNLVRKWGPPQQSYETSGHRFLVYSNDRNVFVPGQAPTYQTSVIGNTAYTNSYGGSPAMNVNLSCTTTFEIADGKITTWSYRGNDCKATD
ncbi:hypothetical protein PS712_01141 [Pseudomonas fluorescens]|uniref:Lipoprotein n=2 Tax=Pseudomonas fluorescens TaxID=294 RepID=A0A5E7N8F1_PSEFL|nr:hypothetical protein [Pseudomonas fluorescens]VVN81608.1 hypothetical protein PS712_01141 [Pseudomonas fluorescens]VVP33488.1 hypothetical protein PS854_04437 [Pseudomonas fluorescens]